MIFKWLFVIGAPVIEKVEEFHVGAVLLFSRHVSNDFIPACFQCGADLVCHAFKLIPDLIEGSIISQPAGSFI